MKLYHGTNHIVVRHPEVRISGYNKDFGFGFYCTQYERQAKRWALTKRGAHIVCVYDYTPNVQLKVKIFPEMTDEWLDFVAACRHGVSHSFDVVEGPMADDDTHQILFCTDRALSTLSYQSHYEL